ncbi:MAG: DUF928 domain-containing protein [Pleurocapsa sp.]
MEAQNKSIYTNKKNQVTFEPPRGDKPQQTAGGASRGGQCLSDSKEANSPIIPLLPTNSPALTVKSHPTLLVYVPETSATEAYFAVRDNNEEYDYQTILPIGDSEGIISLTLPQDAPDLDMNQDYQWSLVLMCDGKLRPDSPVVKGNIKRVASNYYMSQKLTQAGLLESAAIYGKAGIWYDTVAGLAELKTTKPNSDYVSNNWENLLKTVGLERVAQAKFVE